MGNNKEGEKRGGVPVVKMARISLKYRQILGKGDIRLSSKEKRVLVEKGATGWNGKVKRALQRARKGDKEDLKSKKEDLAGKYSTSKRQGGYQCEICEASFSSRSSM